MAMYPKAKTTLILFLVGLFWWLPLSSACSANSELIRLPQTAERLWDTPVQINDRVLFVQEDRSGVWTNASYALGGSALSNTLLIASIAALSLGYSVLVPGGQKFLDQLGTSALLLDLVPMIATPVLMVAWSPRADAGQFASSLLGSGLATALQLLLLVPLALLFNQGNLSDTYQVLLPAILVTAILFQALGSAWGHELGQHWGLSHAGQGLALSYHWEY